MKLNFRIYGEIVDDTTQVTTLSDIMTGSLDGCDENSTIAVLKDLIVTSLLNLQSVNHNFIRLTGRSEDFSDNTKSLVSYGIKDQDELICIFGNDSCIQEKITFSKITSLSEACRCVVNLKSENANLINEIKLVKQVKHFKYYTKYEVIAEKPKFSIEEEIVITSAAEVIQSFRSDEKLILIEDLFNDRTNFTDCSTFDNLQTLNDTMYIPVKKYGDNFEQTNIRIIQRVLLFADNYLIINRNLKRLKNVLIGQSSRKSQLKESEDAIMSQLLQLLNNGISFSRFSEYFNQSTIINEQHAKVILDTLLPKDYGRWKFNLLYRGSRDGKNAATFHKLCDNQGPTLVIIKNAAGHIFGGFAAASWNQSNTYIADSNAFLFTLSNPHGLPPTKFMSNNNNSIYCHGSYGPTFGGGHDLYTNFSSSTFGFPSTYPDSTGRGNLLFTGNQNFDIAEMEVWQCLPTECTAFKGSTILDQETAAGLRLMLQFVSNPTLLYRSSRDGKEASKFHSLCDNQPSTVTIVKDTNGFIFGGYTSASWNSASSNYYNDTNAFLFSLKNPRDSRPAKYLRNTASTYAIYCYPGYGPTFGGHDFNVHNGHIQTKISFPNAYLDTTGFGNKTFNGNTYMTPQEVEVWKV